MSAALTSKEILLALKRHHGLFRSWPMNAEPWAFIEELQIGTAWQCLSRIDALAVKTGRSTHKLPNGQIVTNERIAYEVKVSRSDLIRELKNPWKRQAALSVAHRWVLATPPGLVRDGELPEGAGLVEVHPRGVRWIAQGELTACESPEYFVASIARRATRMCGNKDKSRGHFRAERLP